MITPTEFFVTSFLVLLIFFMWHRKNRSRVPPGPLGLPIVGMIPFRILELLFATYPEEVTDTERFKLNKDKYGSIWSIVFGSQRMVILCSWETIYEAFFEKAELFSGRPRNEFYNTLNREKGILFLDGEIWHSNRQLAIKALRELGMGKKDLENKISDEGDDLVSYLEEAQNTNIDLLEKLTKAISNVVIRLVFHERYRYEDLSFQRYVENLRVVAHSDIAAKKLSISPALFKTRVMNIICPDVKRFLEALEYCRHFIRIKCLSKSKVQDENIQPDCVFDYFHRFRFTSSSLLTADERKENIVEAMFDLFNAGIDTTTNLLSFCFLMLGQYEDLQTELRNEIRELTEDYRGINLEMRKNCPKLLSFIDEVQRFICLVPKVHHRVLQKCVFRGYELYPSDIIFGDLANVFRDPVLFESPNEFNAFRFTDSTRTKYCPSKYLVPFGIGKRACLGESIAQMELFIFLAKIIHKFKIILTKETLNNFEKIVKGQSGMVHAPLDHSMKLQLV